MTTAAVPRRGDIFPGITLPDVDGSSVLLERYRGRKNLVVVFAGDKVGEAPITGLLGELDSRAEEFASEVAQVLLVVPWRPAAVGRRSRSAFPVLLDDGARIHREVGAIDAAGKAAPAVFVTDRFREIYAAYVAGPGSAPLGAKEILDWLVFINIQCPECGVAEWPTR